MGMVATGDVFQAEALPERAWEKFEAALSLIEGLLEDSERVEWLHGKALVLQRIGGVLEVCERTDQAHTRYRESLQLMRRIASIESTPSRFRDVAVGLLRLGGSFQSLEDFESALVCYTESFETSRELATANEAPVNQRDMLVGLHRIGEIKEIRNDLDTALKLHEQAMYIARNLAEKLRSVESLNDLDMSTENVARILKQKNDFKKLLEIYELRLSVAQQQLELNASLLQQAVVADCMVRVGVAHGLLSRLEEARAMFEQALAVRRSLAQITDQLQAERVRAFIWVLSRCSEVTLLCGNFDRAYELTVELWNLMIHECGEDDSLAASERLLSTICPVLRCELELTKHVEAAQSATLVESLVEGLTDAFGDESVDREEQALDSATLFRCAEGMELVARLRGLEGNEASRREAAASAESLRESAEQLKAEEDAATDEDSSS
jgi:tetratricopeptide (TPR) repeat protein